MACHASAPAIGEVRHLGSAEGLSSHRVYSIVEDSDKVIWLGTKNGIDRYNGREIRNYELLGDFYLGDMAARKIQLHKDADGRLWAYDNTGRIYSFSDIHNRFTQQIKLGEAISGDITLNRFITDGDRMLFGLANGLFLMENGHLRVLVPGEYVNDIACMGGRYLAGTSSGVHIIDPENDSSGMKILDGISTETIYFDEATGLLYAGTFNDGLWRIDLTSDRQPACSQVMAVSDPIRSITRLGPDYLAIGIDGKGVLLFDTSRDIPQPLINADDRTDFSIKGNGVYALATNREGDLWIGSYTGGASLVRFSPSPTRRIVHEKANGRSLASNNVNAIAQTANGSIWYATDMGVSISRPDGDWSHCLRNNVCVSLCPVGGNSMAVGTYGDGLFVVDGEGRTLRHLRKEPSGLTSNNIFSIKRDADGDLWIGTVDGYLTCLDPDLSRKLVYPICPALSLTVVDSTRIAAATVNGFYIIDKAANTTDRYATSEEQVQVDMSAYIIPMLFNGDGTVWLGTEGGGLNLYDIANRRIIRGLRMADGLPSNDIYSLIRDNDGDIWIGTGNGVAVVRDSTVTSLNYLHGTAQEYNKSSGTLLADGKIAFGSTSGATVFTPGEIDIVDIEAPLRITRFSVDGIKPEDADHAAERFHRGLEDGSLRLSHDNNSFTIDFESVSLRYQDDIVYRYCLDNFDSDFTETYSGTASYKNLPPGKYSFLLQSVRKSDGAIIDGRSLSITVAQPWYNTWWAWIIYAAILCTAAYFAIRYKLDSIKKRYYEEKINFFINTAHDIRTPVTLAMAPLEDAVKASDLSESTAYLVHTAYHNIRKLKTIVSQLLDFEKIDSNHSSLTMQCIDLGGLLREEALYFQDACQRKGIDLALDVPDGPACISANLGLMENVFDNLISNACKYTAPGGRIAISLRLGKSKVTVDVADSGIGIPENEKKHIFSEVYRAQNARNTQEMGTGFGLLQVKRITELHGGKIKFESSEKTGTVFTLTFKRVSGTPVSPERHNPASDSLNEIASAGDLGKSIGEGSGEKGDTLLIVEDNDDMRRYLGAVFAHGYNVVLRESAEGALEYLGDSYPDLVISDVMMPGMQGDDLCNAIKGNPDTAGIPVILLTAKAGHEAMVSGLTKGADDYFAKPFSTEILKLKVRGLIENRNRLRGYLMRQALEKASDVAVNQPDPGEFSDDSAPQSDVAGSDRAFVEKVTAVVIGNISDTAFTIDLLCREMAMSRSLFYTRLKSLTGKAPQEFIRLIRLEKAADLLRKGLPVTEVAEAAGFINVKYFSTLFKKHYGVQPSRFNADSSMVQSQF